MALVKDKDGKRLHVESRLMGESLVSKEFLEQLDIAPQERLYPDVAVLKIGGQSICDRGIKALPAILKEIVANRKKTKCSLPPAVAPEAAISIPSAWKWACPPASSPGSGA
jgi:molybdenum storage protein